MESVTKRLTQNIASIRYGNVAVTFRIHDGRVVDITHAITELVREKQQGDEDDKE
jgi:hypothetical protein